MNDEKLEEIIKDQAGDLVSHRWISTIKACMKAAIEADREKGCCMTCTHWRPLANGKGDCMNFYKSVYTDEGFYCSDYKEKKEAPND